MAYRILLATETKVSDVKGGVTFTFNDGERVLNYMIGIINWQFKFKKSQTIKSLKIDPTSINSPPQNNTVTITPDISMDGDSDSLDEDYSYIQLVCIAEIDQTDSGHVAFGPSHETVDPSTNYPTQFTLPVDQYAAFWGGCDTDYGSHEQIQTLNMITKQQITDNTLTLSGQCQFKNSADSSSTSQAYANFLGVTVQDEGLLEIRQVINAGGQTKLQSSDQVKVPFNDSITYAVPLIQSLKADFESDQHKLYKLGGGVTADSDDNFKPYFSFEDSILSIDQGASAIINDDNGHGQNNTASYVTLIAVGTNQPPEKNQPPEL